MSKIKEWYEIWAKKKARYDFWKDFFKLMNNSNFGKTMENVRIDRDIKILTTKKEETIWYSNQIIIQQNFLKKFISNRNEKNTNTYK